MRFRILLGLLYAPNQFGAYRTPIDYRQTGGQTDRQTDGQTDPQTDPQTDGQTDPQIDRPIENKQTGKKCGQCTSELALVYLRVIESGGKTQF